MNETYKIQHDGFEGTVIGTYITREGKTGVVLQQVGTQVVHVYGTKWLNQDTEVPRLQIPCTYRTLREANAARQLEWDAGNVITSSFRANELAGEMGEALERALDLIVLAAAVGRLSNTIKKLERERLGIRGSRSTIEQLGEELADVNICTDLVAMEYNIDLDKETRKKFNEVSEKQNLKTRMIE